MISRIRGELVLRDLERVEVMTQGGVAYEVFIPTNVFERLPKLGEQVTRASMTEVGPANLADTKIRVLNASGQGGQAAEVAGQLRDLGFAEPTAENDPLYTNNRLSCQGQIRFGPSGRAAAAAVWLVAPCVELFQDQRPDNTVDLAIGTDFTELTRSEDTEAVLSSLRPEATQPPDPTLISKIHSTTC